MKNDTPTEVAISVSHLSKSFKLPVEATSSIKNLIVAGFKKNQYIDLKILKDINFEVKKGEFFGIVGRNGSGKSTLLKLIAGIYSQDRGNIEISGRLTPFIELGVGFNMELTGKENVYLNGALLGFSRKEMNVFYSDIVDFSELEDFMDQKLKNYSSGMQVRLAFSIAIRAESEILLIDEVLAVGDAVFQKKCFNYFKELRKRNRTVIFISHDVGSLQEFCDRGILIEKGKILSSGDINIVVNDYIDILNRASEAENTLHNANKDKNLRWGIGGIEIVNAHTSNAKNNKKQTIFTDQDKEMKVVATYQARDSIDEPVYGITIADASGKNIFASNTLWQKKKTRKMEPKDKVEIEWKLPNIFGSGKYYISPAVADKYGGTIYDWRENYVLFEVNKKIKNTAIINVNNEISIYYEGTKK